jgi:biotin carboxyl carrier protein
MLQREPLHPSERSDDGVAEEIVESPAPGKVLRVHAEAGKRIAEGDKICILEALKMELPIVAPVGGTVKALRVSPGQAVEAGDVLAIIES